MIITQSQKFKHFISFQSLKVQVAQLCPTLCNSMDCGLPGSSVHGILQATILVWVAIPFSRGSSQPSDQTQVSLIEGGFSTIWATRGAQEYRSGWPIPSPGDLPHPGIKLGSPALQANSLPAELPGKPMYIVMQWKHFNDFKLQICFTQHEISTDHPTRYVFYFLMYGKYESVSLP